MMNKKKRHSRMVYLDFDEDPVQIISRAVVLRIFVGKEKARNYVEA